MRHRIAVWLKKVADWLDPPTDPYRDMTRALIAEAEQRFGAGFGEAKRRDVYAGLMKCFPQARKRDLAFEIERVLQEES